MDPTLDQGFEFLNYENVCPAERDILHNILQGTDSKEYSKRLFTFDTPYNDYKREGFLLEIGQGENSSYSEFVDNNALSENGTAVMPSIIPQSTVTSYYQGGQGHLPVAVSANSGPISSVGPVPMNPGNPLQLMYSPGIGIPPMMTQQQFYANPFFGPQGSQPHISFVPVDNAMTHDGFIAGPPHGQNHKIHHDAHQQNATGGNSYGKGNRRKQQQPPQHPYYFQNYYQHPYFNQQQLQNVTGTPFIMNPTGGMFVPHPGMYPQGNESEHIISTQGAIPVVASDMSFVQQHHHPNSHVYSHSSPTHSRNYSRNNQSSSSQNTSTTAQQEVRVIEKSTPKNINNNNNVAASAVASASVAETPNSIPDLSNSSNGEMISFFVEENLDTLAPCESKPKLVNGTEISANFMTAISSPCKTDVTDDNNLAENIKATKNIAQNSAEQVDVTTAIVVPIKQINGDADAESSKTRDNLSADHKSTSDVTIEQQNNVKNSKSSSDVSKSSNNISSDSCNNSSPNNNSLNTSATAAAQDRQDTITKINESNAIEASKSAMSVVKNEIKPQIASRSWANIASVKSQSIPNYDGAGGEKPVVVNSSSNQVQQIKNDSMLRSAKSVIHHPIILDGKDYEMLDDSSDEFDPVAVRLGEHFTKYQLEHQSIPMAPRGLYNQSNSCFLNAILQALLACPPFVNTFRSTTYILDKMSCKSAPITQIMFDFVREFSPLSRNGATPITKKDKQRDNFIPGPNLEPLGIRKSLALLSKDTFKIEGRQEDAEEFLSFLLNFLHEEMIKVMKLSEKEKIPHPKVVSPVNVNGEEAGEHCKEDEEDDDQWQVMGAKNKSCLTRRTAITKSPISEAFLGQMCLSLNRANSLKKADLEPFFTLQLAIQNDSITSVKEALDAISIKEEVSGITSANGSEVEAWRQVSLEELPPVLILHLKRFVYEKNGILKINKKLEYSVDLEIGKELLSNNSKNKYNSKQRQYKLFAVVYHDGEDAHKGHYVADCFHPSGGTLWGQWGWLRYDDTCVKPVSEANMLNPQAPRVPYLLFYRRQDTILLQNKKAS